MRDVEEPPDTVRLYTPMREGACGVRLALFRDRHGDLCAVGFSSAEGLEQVLGPGYEAWRMGRWAVRELAEARGVSRILVDPVFAAAGISDGGRPADLAVSEASKSDEAVPAHKAPAEREVPAEAVGVAATSASESKNNPHRDPIPTEDRRPAAVRRVDPQVAGALAVCAVAGAAAVFLGELR
jgi:hypothetical protein